MKRIARSHLLISWAAALALLPTAAVVGAEAGAPPTAADYQALQQHYQQVQQQLSTLSSQVGNIREQQENINKQEALIKQQQAALAQQQAALKAQQAQMQAAAANGENLSQQASDKLVEQIYNKVMADTHAQTQHWNNIGKTFNSLFAPRTSKTFVSPIAQENPDHMRPDMHMQIGQWDDMKFYMGFWTVGRVQAIQQWNANASLAPSSKYGGLNPGFQDPFANLSLYATIPGKFDMFADFYVASRPHPNTMYGHEGYLVFKQMPNVFGDGSPITNTLDAIFNYVNVKVGAFDIDFGDNNYHRSNNAWVQNNLLIGNPLVDPNVEEIGGEVYSVKGPVYWLFGAGNGFTTEHFDYGSPGSVHAKIWGFPTKDLRMSVSGYLADLSGGTGYEQSDLFAAGRSGGAYAAVFGGGDDPGQIQPQHGKNIVAVQGDITYQHWPWELYTFVGWTQDSNTNGDAGPGTPAERWLYGSAEAAYHITPAWYVAARYSFAFAESIAGNQTNGWVDRIQVGTGYWLTRSVLTKLEYVQEEYRSFGTNVGNVDGVEAYYGPGFQGAVAEVSFGF